MSIKVEANKGVREMIAIGSTDELIADVASIIQCVYGKIKEHDAKSASLFKILIKDVVDNDIVFATTEKEFDAVVDSACKNLENQKKDKDIPKDDEDLPCEDDEDDEDEDDEFEKKLDDFIEDLKKYQQENRCAWKKVKIYKEISNESKSITNKDL